MEAQSLVASSTTAFAVSVLFMLLLCPVSGLLGLMDRPGGHKTHDGEVPVIGGIAIYLGLVAAMLFGVRLGNHGYAMLVAAGLMVLVGALDDRFSLPALTRLYVQLIAAIVLVSWTGFRVADLGNLLGTGVIGLSFLGPVFTVVACAALMNAFNMLDGLDGLAGGAALMACVALAFMAFLSGRATAAVVAASMTGATLGFLVFNVPVVGNRPLRAFMGDAGSTLLGFIIAALALTLVQTDRADVPPIVIPWLVCLPIFELFASTFRRLRRGNSPFAPDNGHFHHVLLRAGLSVRAIFLLYFVSSAVMAAIGTWAYYAGAPDSLMFFGLVASFAGWLLFVHSVGRVVGRLPRVFRRIEPAQTH